MAAQRAPGWPRAMRGDTSTLACSMCGDAAMPASGARWFDGAGSGKQTLAATTPAWMGEQRGPHQHGDWSRRRGTAMAGAPVDGDLCEREGA
jgi:hypothetical protein